MQKIYCNNNSQINLFNVNVQVEEIHVNTLRENFLRRLSENTKIHICKNNNKINLQIIYQLFLYIHTYIEKNLNVHFSNQARIRH